MLDRTGRNRPVILGLTLVLATLFLLAPPGLVLMIRGRAGLVLSPLAGLGQSLASPITGPIEFIRQLAVLVQENQALVERVQELEASTVELAALKAENENLRRELKASDRPAGREKLVAAVINRDPISLGQRVTLDVGRVNNVSLGQGVTAQGFLIGRISQVSQYSSQVELITSYRFRLPVRLVKSGAIGLLKGGLGGLTVEDLPSDLVFEQGEPVVSTQIENILPEGLPIGQVTKIQESSNILRTLEVAPSVQAASVQIVSLILSQ